VAKAPAKTAPDKAKGQARDKTPGESAGFLGRGWSFPPRFDPAKGEITMVEREADIRESLRILFLTRKGERVMHPNYGCALHDLVFEPMNSQTAAAIDQTIRQAILFYEPRIDVLSVDVQTQNFLEGRLSIQLDYRIRATNTRQNVVFPFYIHEGTLLSGTPADPGTPAR